MSHAAALDGGAVQNGVEKSVAGGQDGKKSADVPEERPGSGGPASQHGDIRKQLKEKIGAFKDYLATAHQSCASLKEQESRVKSELELQRDIVQSAVSDAFAAALEALITESLNCRKQHDEAHQVLAQDLKVMELLSDEIEAADRKEEQDRPHGSAGDLLQRAGLAISSKLDCRTQHARININFPRQQDVLKAVQGFFNIDLLNQDIITFQWPKPQLSRETAPVRFRSMSNPYATSDRWRKAWIVKADVEDLSFDCQGNLVVVTQNGIELIKSNGAMSRLLDAHVAKAKVSSSGLIVALISRPVELKCYRHDGDGILELVWSHPVNASSKIDDYVCLSVMGDTAALLVCGSLWLYRVSDGVHVKTLTTSPEGCQLFQDAYCIYMSSRQRFLITEGGDDVSLKAIDQDGRLLWRYGGSMPSENASAWKPISACEDSDGNVYVADFANNRIVQVATDGRFVGYAVGHRDGIAQAKHLAFYGNNTLAVNVVSDTVGKAVMVFQKV